MVNAVGAVRPLLDALERVSSPIAKKQVLNAVGALMGVRDEFYPLLAQEPHARDEAVHRMLATGLRAEGTAGEPGFRALRRQRRGTRALDRYLAGDLNGALAHVARTVPPGTDSADGPSADALEWTLAAAARRPLTQEEFLLALFAVREMRGPTVNTSSADAILPGENTGSE
jgi:hypothetical protein